MVGVNQRDVLEIGEWWWAQINNFFVNRILRAFLNEEIRAMKQKAMEKSHKKKGKKRAAKKN